MHGHLVLADISGYTRFLTETELEHANGIINDLLNSVITAIQAPLSVSGIEGDAVFMHGQVPRDITGQAVVESVEHLYSAFASALETMVLNTTCRCNACANINTLGLKIIMHCGEYVTSELAGRETVSGPEVILIHRLLKNSIIEDTGIDDYLFVTRSCVDDLGIEDMVSDWVRHSEEYHHVGTVTGYVASLREAWAQIRTQKVDKVSAEEVWAEFSAVSSAPPTIVWDHLLDPAKRVSWMRQADVYTGDDQGPRIEAGSVFHCAHGDGVVQPITILDMRPLEYMTYLGPIGSDILMRYTDYLIPEGSGTRVISWFSALTETSTGKPLPAEQLASLLDTMGPTFQESLNTLIRMSSDAAASQIEP